MTEINTSWIALGLSVAASIVGQGLLKAGASAGEFQAQLTDARSVGGLAAYGIAALLYMLALRHLPMSVALPLSAATYVGGALLGYTVFAERMNPGQLAGLAIISVGVLVLGASSS